MYPTTGELPVLFYRDNDQGPWAGELFRKLLPDYDGLYDIRLYQSLKKGNPEDVMLDVEYYMEHTIYLKSTEEQAKMQKSQKKIAAATTDASRYLRGRQYFADVWKLVIYPAFKKTELQSNLWKFITTSRARMKLGFMQYANVLGFNKYKESYKLHKVLKNRPEGASKKKKREGNKRIFVKLTCKLTKSQNS
jgi:hypothetical protein